MVLILLLCWCTCAQVQSTCSYWKLCPFVLQSYLPCHQYLGDLSGKGLGHLPAAHVGDAVQSQAHEGGVAAGQVVLDGVVDQANQLTVRVHQDGDEEIALGCRSRKGNTDFS